MTVALIAVSFVVQADSFFRMDLDGRKENIELKVKCSDEIKAVFPSQNGVADKNLVYTAGRQKLSATDWKEYEVSFIPGQSGRVGIAVKGQWTSVPEKRGWMLINNIAINGEIVKNGDFRKFWRWKAKGDKLVPNNFVLGENARYIPCGGKEDTPAVLVNHDNPLFFGIHVEAGKNYTLKCLVKAEK